MCRETCRVTGYTNETDLNFTVNDLMAQPLVTDVPKKVHNQLKTASHCTPDSSITHKHEQHKEENTMTDDGLHFPRQLLLKKNRAFKT